VGAATFLDWVRGADVLLCNADEAATLAGPGGPAEQAAALTDVVRHVIVKRGDAGAVWGERDTALRVGRAVQAEVVDATGAGDAFAAGLLAAWTCGAEPADALAAGMRLGAAAVGRVGARP
jgi:ribokinase